MRKSTLIAVMILIILFISLKICRADSIWSGGHAWDGTYILGSATLNLSFQLMLNQSWFKSTLYTFYLAAYKELGDSMFRDGLFDFTGASDIFDKRGGSYFWNKDNTPGDLSLNLIGSGLAYIITIRLRNKGILHINHNSINFKYQF